MNKKHRKTLEALFNQPVSTTIRWKDIEALILSLGGEISEGSGSRIRIKLKGVRAVFHRPHPQPTTDQGAVISVKRFLTNAGVKP